MRPDATLSGIIAPRGSSDLEGLEPVRTLSRMASHSPAIAGVWAREVQPGDWVVVRTRNSVYVAAALGDGTYDVAGGWFSGSRAHVRVQIAGCTWGGSAIHTGLVAAEGMFLEFDNGVRTTRIQDVRLIRSVSGREQ